jgi:hypothetical protein
VNHKNTFKLILTCFKQIDFFLQPEERMCCLEFLFGQKGPVRFAIGKKGRLTFLQMYLGPIYVLIVHIYNGMGKVAFPNLEQNFLIRNGTSLCFRVLASHVMQESRA